MRIGMTALAGCAVLFFAISGFLATKYWVESRTLRAVDIPVSLARGTVSVSFKLNAHGFYSILVGEEQGGPSACNVGLETRRLSSIGGLPVYRYQWLESSSRSSGRNTIAGYFLGGFEGKPGSYHLEIEVVSDTACLNAGKPHLYVMASDKDFYEWDQRYLKSIWIWGIVGLLGFILMIASVLQAVRERSDTKNNLDLF
jgi:hypothetical protein